MRQIPAIGAYVRIACVDVGHILRNAMPLVFLMMA